MSKNGILVFAGKQVGLKLTHFLLTETNCPVSRVIAATADDQEILRIARDQGVSTEIYHPNLQKRLVESGERYSWILNLWSPHYVHAPLLIQADHRLNIHPGLAPHCRGNDCAAWAIRKQLPAGVSLLEMREELDAGEIYARREIPYEFGVSGKQLHDQLQEMAVDLFKDSWESIYFERLKPVPQVGPVTTHTRRQTNTDRVLTFDDRLTIEEFIRWAKAHDFSPGTTAEIRSGDSTYKVFVKLEKVA